MSSGNETKPLTALDYALGYARNSIAMADAVVAHTKDQEVSAAYKGASELLTEVLAVLENPGGKKSSGKDPSGRTSTYTTELECPWEFEGEIEPFQPGQFSGPPEACFPDEGGYATLVSGTIGNHVFNHIELAAIFSEDDIQAIEEDLYDSWLTDQEDTRDYEAGC